MVHSSSDSVPGKFFGIQIQEMADRIVAHAVNMIHYPVT